jgi:hypothetical protein
VFACSVSITDISFLDPEISSPVDDAAKDEVVHTIDATAKMTDINFLIILLSFYILNYIHITIILYDYITGIV